MNTRKLSPQSFSPAIYSMEHLSKKSVEEHIKLYQGYVNKYNEIQEKITAFADDDYAKANQVYSYFRELKLELSFAWGGIVNHEIYFSHLGGTGGKASGDLLKQIEKDFGSFEAYKKDMKATGISARGWVWTAWNFREQRLMNYLGDAQNTFPVWGAEPIVALDTYEHAYFMDYGVNRGGYIDAFFSHMNWPVVERMFGEVMAGCRCVSCDCEKC